MNSVKYYMSNYSLRKLLNKTTFYFASLSVFLHSSRITYRCSEWMNIILSKKYSPCWCFDEGGEECYLTCQFKISHRFN